MREFISQSVPKLFNAYLRGPHGHGIRTAEFHFRKRQNKKPHGAFPWKQLERQVVPLPETGIK
jgi:type VI protein secretion system component Hcp